tara:strand:- start:349 stop:723 length:375 start_codon:yes stop_codon:yes gene_type:complete
MKSFKQYCKEDLSIEDADGKVYAEIIDIVKPEPMKVPQSNIYYEDPIEESIRIPSKTGNIITVYLAWRGSSYNIQMFFPQVSKPSRKAVQDQLQKIYPGAKLWGYQVSDNDPGEPLLQVGGTGK